MRAYFNGDEDIGDTDSFPELWDDENGGRRDVDRVIFHPMYDHDRYDYDIAVIHFASPFSDVDTIPLANCNRTYKPILVIDLYHHPFFHFELYINVKDVVFHIPRSLSGIKILSTSTNW